MVAVRRLSMTGAVEHCDADDTEEKHSLHSQDRTVVEDVSSSSIRSLEVKKVPMEKPSSSTPKKPVSRRRSLFGSSTSCNDSVEHSNSAAPAKAKSKRRNSVFGMLPSDVGKIVSEEKEVARPKSQRRSSISNLPPREESQHDSVRSSNSRKSSSKGRSLDLALGRVPPRPTRSGKSEASESSHSTLKSSASNGSASGHQKGKTKNLVGETGGSRTPVGKMRKPRRPSASNSSHHTSRDEQEKPRSARISRSTSGSSKDNDPFRSPKPGTGRRRSLTGSSKDSIEQSPPPLTPRSLLGGLGFGKGGSNHSSDAIEDNPKKPRSWRRWSLTGNSNGEDKDVAPATPRSQKRRSLTGAPSTATTPESSAPTVNPLELVNKSRAEKGLPEFSRNMLMDTFAKQMAMDLAATSGSKCCPTNYYGNVGQGDSVESIHKSMISLQGTARSNILSKRFSEIGIGMKRARNGTLYLCQLFQ